MTHASIVSGHAANHESSTSSAAKAYKAKVLAGNNGRLAFDCVLFRSHSHIFWMLSRLACLLLLSLFNQFYIVFFQI